VPFVDVFYSYCTVEKFIIGSYSKSVKLSYVFQMLFKFNESNLHIITTWEDCHEMNNKIVNEILTSGFFQLLGFFSVAAHSVIFFCFLFGDIRSLWSFIYVFTDCSS
jgi:hypothetical protein